MGYGLREHAYEIPVMIGSVFGEFSFAPAAFNKMELTQEAIEEIIHKVYGDHTKEAIDAFTQAYQNSLRRHMLREEKPVYTCMILRWNFLMSIIKSHGTVLIFHSSSTILTR